MWQSDCTFDSDIYSLIARVRWDYVAVQHFLKGLGSVVIFLVRNCLGHYCHEMWLRPEVYKGQKATKE